MVSGKIAGVPMLTIAGLLSAVVTAVLFVLVATNRALSGGYPAQSIIALFGRCVRRRQASPAAERGDRPRRAMKELPPE